MLALIHGTVHARLKERLRWCIRPGGNEFIEFINIALEIAPEEGRLSISLAGMELEFLANKEYALFVGLRDGKVGRWSGNKGRTLFLVFKQLLITFLIYPRYD
jgi:hypothetical protein